MQTLLGHRSERSSEQDLERFDNAARQFRQLMQRCDDRLRLEGNVWWKEYLSGRMAVTLECEVTAEIQPNFAGGVSKDSLRMHRVFTVLKANVPESHKLDDWNNKMVLVPDVQIVNSPNGIIPSLIGFYLIADKITNVLARSLFQFAL